MPYDGNKHRRRSIRLPGYDYRSPGACFVTIWVRRGECLLGQVVDEAAAAHPALVALLLRILRSKALYRHQGCCKLQTSEICSPSRTLASRGFLLLAATCDRNEILEV
mgnify:CR=1 FL=1